MKKIQINRLLLFISFAWLSSCIGSEAIDLSGEWKVRLDPKAEGVTQEWWSQPFKEICRLPGSLAENGLGDPVGPETPWVTTGQHLEALKKNGKEFLDLTGKYYTFAWMNPGLYYVGQAWFQKEVELPKSPSGKYRLSLERVLWRTTVWVNGKNIGKRTTLFTPHIYEFEAEGKVIVTICNDNSRIKDISIGNPAHGLSDMTQGMWNGIIGRIAIEALPVVILGEGRWEPRFGAREVAVSVPLRGLTDPQSAQVDFNLKDSSGKNVLSNSSLPLSQCQFDEKGLRATFSVPKTIEPWDEFTPTLYHAELTLKQNGVILGRTTQRIGFRDLEKDIKNKRLLLNNKPLFVRSTTDSAIFPQGGGYIPMDLKTWRRTLKQIKDYGCNSVRFHSYTPPEAAFIAADELGIYLQPEICWSHVGANGTIDQWIMEEGKNILEAYGDHPSFVYFVCGNEMGGPNDGRSIKQPPFYNNPIKDEVFNNIMAKMQGAKYLSQWVPAMEALSPLQFVAGSAGWPYIEEEAFHIHHKPFRDKGLYQLWGPRSTWDYKSIVDYYNRPLISHETGQWCAFPALDSAAKFTGVLKMDFLKMTELRLKKNGLYEQHKDFTRVTGKSQVLFYKESIEALRRTPGAAGYHLLALQDFTGQGAAIVGVLDPFYEEKGYCTAKDFSLFNKPTLPLAMMDKRTFTSDESFTALVRVAHYGPASLPASRWKWSLSEGDQSVSKGILEAKAIEVGEVGDIGSISSSLKSITKATKLTLNVSLEDGRFPNCWEIWVYPATLTEEKNGNVMITREITPAIEAHLNAGGAVIFSPKKNQMRAVRGSLFEPTFWSGGSMFGLLIQDKHPALLNFPTEDYKNMQWWEPILSSSVISTQALPAGITQIVQVVDSPYECQKLGLVFEALCGKGKLIFSAIDLIDTLEKRPVSRQLRYSLMSYAASPTFNPKGSLSLKELESFASLKAAPKQAAQPAQKQGKQGISVYASSEIKGGEAANAIDGNRSTFWSTSSSDDAPGFPHELTIQFNTLRQLDGVELVPQPDNDQNLPQTIEVYTSSDGVSWGNSCLTIKFENKLSAQKFIFTKPETTMGIRLKIIGSHGKLKSTGLAEVIPIDQYGGQDL